MDPFKTKKRRKPLEVGRHLIVHPNICFGALTFRGTRLPVETVLNRLAKGRTIDSILASWPEVKREAIVEAIRLAKDALLAQYTIRHGAGDEPVRAGRSA